MNRLVARVAVAAVVGVVVVQGGAVPAVAQVEQSEIGSEQGGLESAQLITSSDEVRRAVIGLLVIAGVAFLVFVVYWAFTGRAAKARFAGGFGGRHVVEDRPRRGRRRRSAGVPSTNEPVTAVAPGAVEPPRRRVQAQAQAAPILPPAVDEPRVAPGWVDSDSRHRVPVTGRPAWVDQASPAPAQATVARHAAPTHDPERPWRDAGGGAWPQPFDGR